MSIKMISLLLLTLITGVVHAKVSFEEANNGDAFAIHIDGEIDQQSVKDFDSAMTIATNRKRTTIFIDLNSRGGDAEAAMEIGREIRRSRFTTAVFPNKVCASACVLILAGAVSRDAFGAVIIHRPYFDNTRQRSFNDTQTAFEKLSDEVKSYLREMNVPTSLWDDMVAIPPQNGKRLSKSDLNKYLLDGNDPVYDEQVRQELANRLGITMREYLDRLALSNQECSGITDNQAQLKCRCSRLGFESMEKCTAPSTWH